MHTSGNMNVKHMRTYVCALAAIAASLAWAMPTKQEIKRVQPLVNELMSEHVKDYRSGRKSAKEVGDAAAGLVDKAEGEAAKFVLIRGAVYYYSVAKEFDKAADVLETIRTHISDIPPSDVNDLASMALANAGRGGAQRLRDIQRVASEQVAAAKDIADCKAKLKKNGRDDAVLRELAAAYVRYGNWPRALKVFAVLGVKAAIYERDPEDAKDFDELKAADYWWNFKAKDPAPYKAHAADLYRKAIKKGLAEGLKEVLVKKRLAEAEALAPSAATFAAKYDATRLYCVIDLSAGPNAQKYPVSYLAAEPKGGWTNEYKTSKLVLRRIEPGTFIMGENQNIESHRVTLTQPFYIGVFEVTAHQYKLVTGENPSAFNKGPTSPVSAIKYDMVRGASAGSQWPESAAVDKDSFFGRLRAKTGIETFDLPTEAQWEYACRAGTTSRFGNCTDKSASASIAAQRWRVKYVAVGSYAPNKWGLYDMHGNVCEWCLDWMGPLPYGTNPKGVSAKSGSKHVCRGGSYYSSFAETASWSRWDGEPIPGHLKPSPGRFGFRVAIQPQPVK